MNDNKEKGVEWTEEGSHDRNDASCDGRCITAIVEKYVPKLTQELVQFEETSSGRPCNEECVTNLITRAVPSAVKRAMEVQTEQPLALSLETSTVRKNPQTP